MDKDMTKVVVKAYETLNIFDLTTLLSLYSFIYHNPDKVKKVEIKTETELLEEDYLIRLPSYSFIRDYCKLNPRGGNKTIIFESLRRMNMCSWELYFNNGDITIFNIIKDLKQNKGTWNIILNKEVVDKLLKKDNKEKWLFFWIVMDYVRKCKTDTGKALCIWLQGQKNTGFYENVLIQALNIKTKEHRNKLIKLRKAFTDVTNSGFLKNWEEKEREAGLRFFKFTKSQETTIANCSSSRRPV